MTTRCDDFESWDAFLDFLKSTPPQWLRENCASITRGADAWSGKLTFDQALSYAEFGWPEGRELLSEVSPDMKPDNVEVSEVQTERVDVAGAYPIVPLALAGEPTHMVDIERQEVAHKIIRCAASISHAGGVAPEALTAHGAAVASYVDALEAAGWRVEVVVYFDSRNGDNLYSVRVMVKRAEDPLDLDRLTFALAHPAMLRKLLFRCLESHHCFERSHKGGYGYPATERPEDCQMYVDKVPSGFSGSPEHALERVAMCLDDNLRSHGS